MASTSVKLGYGTLVRIGRGGTPTWTTLLGVGDVTFPEQIRPDVDVTHMQSPGETEEGIPGLRPLGDWTLSQHYVQGNAVDLLLSDLEGTGETVLLEITPPDGTAVQWSGYVKGWTPTFPVKSQQMADLKMTIMAKVVD